MRLDIYVEEDSGSGSKEHFLMTGCSTPTLKDTWGQTFKQCYAINENGKKHHYNKTTMGVDQESFKPLVFTANLIQGILFKTNITAIN